MNPQSNSYRGKERTVKVWDGFNHDGSRRWVTKPENVHHTLRENKPQPLIRNFSKPQPLGKPKPQNIKKILQKGDSLSSGNLSSSSENLLSFSESLLENKSSDTKITSRL